MTAFIHLVLLTRLGSNTALLVLFLTAATFYHCGGELAVVILVFKTYKNSVGKFIITRFIL